MVNNKIQIEIHKDTWQLLNNLKQPGESFDTVIKRILKIKKNDN